MFFYSDTKVPFDGQINVWGFKPETVLARYIQHYDNYLVLHVYAKESTSFFERQQAEKEIKIALKKLAFWERHPSADKAEIKKAKEERVKLWKGRV